jgi:uncharacterized protein with FMN-binding domain
MMTKKLLIAATVLVAMSLALAACFVESDPNDIPTGEPLKDDSGNLISGTAQGTAEGYAGPITVTLTMDEGHIIDVKIEGPGDAASLGGNVIKTAPDSIKKANSFDIDALASVSPFKFTKGAIKSAGEQALAKITEGE